MDGVHDLGGLDGFGPVDPDGRPPPSEPPFAADWERQALRATFGVSIGTRASGGRFRHSIERMDPAHYLSSSYYEHWITGAATMAVEAGLVSHAELEERARGRFPLSHPDRGVAPSIVFDAEPRFEVGDVVRVREMHVQGHSRAPRYVQGKIGVIVRYDGAYSVPDVEAHSDERVKDHTYSVRFTPRELWGEAGNDIDSIHVDLWEVYLE